MTATGRIAPVFPRGSLRRSIGLFRAFLVEQSDPDRFYSMLAADSVAEVLRYADLESVLMVDIGGGPGYFSDAFEAAGARYLSVEPDAGELTGGPGGNGRAVRASGLELPFADDTFGLVYSSNVLEHVPDPERMLREMTRVAAPGALVVVSWTPWLSPWGGHETAPWHYFGGRRAADRYARRHGTRPKNDFGRSLFACSVRDVVSWARAAERAGSVEIVDILPRYHPSWARWVVHVAGVREIATWNVVVLVEKAHGSH